MFLAVLRFPSSEPGAAAPGRLQGLRPEELK